MIIPTQYVDNETLTTLGLKNDVDMLLNNVRLHYLMLSGFTLFVNLTLKFRFTLEVKSYKVPDDPTDEALKLKTTYTMSFQLHNSDYKIPIKTMKDIFHIPADGECDVPKYFN